MWRQGVFSKSFLGCFYSTKNKRVDFNGQMGLLVFILIAFILSITFYIIRAYTRFASVIFHPEPQPSTEPKSYYLKNLSMTFTLSRQKNIQQLI